MAKHLIEIEFDWPEKGYEGDDGLEIVVNDSKTGKQKLIYTEKEFNNLPKGTKFEIGGCAESGYVGFSAGVAVKKEG